MLITDAISATGMPDGRYQLGPIEVEVKDGKCTANGSLAGSVLTMDRAVRNVTQFSNWSLREAVRAATFNPRTAVGLSGELWSFGAGRACRFHGVEFFRRSDENDCGGPRIASCRARGPAREARPSLACAVSPRSDDAEA